MADQSTTAAASQTSTVETFLNALQEQDFDTAESALAQNLVYQNVGFPTIYGRNRAMKLFRSMPGRMGFEVKIHRIAADGAAVLTERTDALVFGPMRLQFWVCGCSRCTKAESRCGGTTSTCSTWSRRRCAASSAWSCRPCARRCNRGSGAAQLAQFVERLRPAEQTIGGARQLAAVALLCQRRCRALAAVHRRHQLRCGGDHLVVLPHTLPELSGERVDGGHEMLTRLRALLIARSIDTTSVAVAAIVRAV